MHKDRYVWAWVGGAIVLILAILGVWWWDAGSSPVSPVGDVASTTVPLGSLAVPSAAAQSGTVASVVAGLSQGTRFAALLSQTGVSAQLRGKGPYTVFVPSNESFSLLPPGALNLSAAQLTRLVEYHIVVGRAIDINAQTQGTYPALSKDMLNFSVFPQDKSARINSAEAIREYKASNGVVYVINEVLLPPLNP